MRGAVLTMRGSSLLLRGKTPEARPVLAEAFRLAEGLDWLGPDWPWLHILLRTRIPLGEFEQARAESAELYRRAREAGVLATVSAAGLIMADAAFRLGDWEAAKAAALQTFQLAEEVGHRHMAGWALTIRIRILAAQGRTEQSRAAAAARCRGLLDDDFDAAFAGALAFDDRRPMPFERARTQLAFGRRLHRACRRAAARQQLRAALGGFERLHADAWAGQAEAELRAAGGRHRPPQDDRALTPQELRVAAAVQRGASNRDIAADLFLSPKTVEFHLRQIFRKLDVRSRTQLVAALADKDTAS